MASMLASQPVMMSVRSSPFERGVYTNIFEARVHRGSFAMTKDHLNLS